MPPRKTSMQRCAITPNVAKAVVKPRPRKCANKTCRALFEKRSKTHVACSTDCAIVVAQEKRRKAERIDVAKRKDAIKTIPQLKEAAKRACHAYIRYRDRHLPCICCGKFATDFYLTGGEWDAGHYRSVGSADHLRFDERNIHRQLKNCNRDKAGRAVEYRQGLIKRFDVAYVEALESDNALIKWTREMLREIIAMYKAKLKQLKKETI